MTFKIFCLLLIITSTTVTCKRFFVDEEVSWMILKKGSCTLEDIKYLPAGRTVKIKRATSASAKLQGTLIEKFAGTGSEAITISKESTSSVDAFHTAVNQKKTTAKIFESLLKIAPKFAQALGVFGVVFTFIGDANKPGPQQIIDSTNVAFEEMTETLNQKLDEMQGYVTEKVIGLEKEIILREFKVMQTFWLNCVTELTTDAINECQRDASRLIRASSAKFMLFNEKQTARFSSKEKVRKSASLDPFAVRKLEAAFFPFRDYVTLSINVMTTLIASYKLKAMTCEEPYTNKFKTFVQEQINDIKEFKTYAVWAYEQFVKVHTYNNQKALITCKNVSETEAKMWDGIRSEVINRVYECKSVFDATLDKSKTCNIKYRVRVKKPEAYRGRDYILVKARTEVAAVKDFAIGHSLGKLNEEYYKQLKLFMKKFWDNEVFDVVPKWEAVLKDAEGMLKALIEKCGTAEEKKRMREEEAKKEEAKKGGAEGEVGKKSTVDHVDDYYSSNFYTRLEKVKRSLNIF